MRLKSSDPTTGIKLNDRYQIFILGSWITYLMSLLGFLYYLVKAIKT